MCVCVRVRVRVSPLIQMHLDCPSLLCVCVRERLCVCSRESARVKECGCACVRVLCGCVCVVRAQCRYILMVIHTQALSHTRYILMVPVPCVYASVGESLCVCVCGRELVCMRLCERACVYACVGEREQELVSACVRERERVCVCVGGVFLCRQKYRSTLNVSVPSVYV